MGFLRKSEGKMQQTQNWGAQRANPKVLGGGTKGLKEPWLYSPFCPPQTLLEEEERKDEE